MKFVVKRTGAVRSGLHVVVIREPDDPLACAALTLCVRDSSGNVVYSKQFGYDVGIDPDVKEYVFDVSFLSDGVYKVDIYNWTDCNPTWDFIDKATYYIHKVSSGSTLMLSSSWNYNNNKWLILYVYDGKLFVIYDENVSGVTIPMGIPVYAEITDGNGNAFVGSVTASYAVTWIEPNMKVPFMAIFTIKLDKPRAGELVRHIYNVLGFMHGAAVQLVDDYTFNIVIVKTEPGIPPLVAYAIIALAGAAIAWAVAWGVVRVSEINLQAKALDSAKPAIDIAAEAFKNYSNEVSKCAPNDMQCVTYAQYKWFPLIQSANALATKIINAGLPVQPTTCDGLKLSGVCVPWWVVAVAIFLGGLLVIAAVK
jgi:hypothetical protein